MRQKTKQEDLMIRYLLGELTEEEQTEIEERFLTDNEYFEQLRSVEDALIDDYAQGFLNEYERDKVEELLLSSPPASGRNKIRQRFNQACFRNPLGRLG